MRISASWIGACGLAATVWLAGVSAVAAAPEPEPVQLSIGGGSVDSAAFRWSSALAQILSRPPGLPACERDAPCGVPGVIAGAQTYDQPAALVKAVADGGVATAILPAMDIFRERCQSPEAPAIGVLKTLYRQPVQILLKADGAIARVNDLAGKNVAIGEAGSNAEAVALDLFDAYGIARAKLKLQRMPFAAALTALRKGDVAAAILLGHAFDIPIGDLMAGGGYTLLSLPDSPERQKLMRALPVFDADAIPPGAYPGVPATSTLSQPVLWVAKPNFDPGFAEKLVSAVSEPHNLARLAGLVEPVAGVPEGEAFTHLPAPPSEGARRFAAARGLPVDVLGCPTPKAPPEPAPPRRAKSRSRSR